MLDSYKYDLYDAQQTLVSTSGVKFVGSSPPPPSIHMSLVGLQTTLYTISKALGLLLMEHLLKPH